MLDFSPDLLIFFPINNMAAQPSPTASRAIITVFASIAILLTVFRLSYRWRIRRFWWDDAWAASSMLFQLALLIAFWIRTDLPVGPLYQSQHARAIAYWIVSESFTMVLWTARMSLLYSAIRIIPPGMFLRKIAYASAVLFGCMWAGLLAQKVYVCAHNRAWERSRTPQCHLGDAVGIIELVTDFISDAILVAIPLRLLWGVNMPRHMRKLLISIFSASILVTAISAVHAAYLLGPSGILEGLAANVECAVSLIVANLAVVVTHLYRLIRNGEDIDQASYDTSGMATTRLGFGGLRRLANRARFGTRVSSMRFTKPANTQADPEQDTRSGGETTMDTDTQALSKIYHPLTLATDVSDDRDQDEKVVGTWSRNKEEAGLPHSPTVTPVPAQTNI